MAIWAFGAACLYPSCCDWVLIGVWSVSQSATIGRNRRNGSYSVKELAESFPSMPFTQKASKNFDRCPSAHASRHAMANKPLKGPQFCWGCQPASSKRNPSKPTHKHSSAGSRWAYLFRIPESYELKEGDPEPYKQSDKHCYLARWKKRQDGETLHEILESCEHVVIGELPGLERHEMLEGQAGKNQENGEPWKICSQKMQVLIWSFALLAADQTSRAYSQVNDAFCRNQDASARGGPAFVLLCKRDKAATASGPQIILQLIPGAFGRRTRF